MSCLVTVSVTTAQSGRLKVMVDERMELLTTIQYLSGYPVLTQADLTYKRDVDAYFKDFKDHNAVLLNKKIYRRFFGFDAPPTYLYHFSFPGFKQIAPFSKDDLDTYGFEVNKDTLTLLLNEFRDFYHKSRFHDFYLSHTGFYDSLIKPVKNKLAETDILEILEQHYGLKNKEYNIILSPMLHDGGYGPQISVNGGQALYAIIGPKYDSKELPGFDIDNLLSEYLIHEFSHSFCNPMIARYWKQLMKDSCLLDPIKAGMKEQGYGDWEACLYEHLVRANEIFLTKKIFGEEKAAALSADMIGNGQWIYLKGLSPIIDQYGANRIKYRTLDDIMTLVISYFDDQAKGCR